MCQMVWIQIRTDSLSVLIWVQTVCNGYQQTTKVATSKERVKTFKMPFDYLCSNDGITNSVRPDQSS